MSLQEPITQWISLLREGNADAMHQIWEQYFSRLCQLTRKRIPDNARREFDEEDVALSAIDCLYRGVQDGRFPRINDRDNLWALLVVIAARKISHKLRDKNALKRGGGKHRLESADSSREEFIHNIAGKEPTPELAFELAEEAEKRLNSIDDATLRKVAELKMSGFSNGEIAKMMECGKRTVERRLMIIRKMWNHDDE